MRHHGLIDTWQDERGFGFITPAKGGRRVFVHVKSFSNRGRRPAAGEAVTYLLKRDGEGRLQAVQVAFANAPNGVRTAPGQLLALLVAGAALAGVAAAVTFGALPPLVLPAYLAASLLTFLAYALDKSLARRNRWRTKETTLHLFSLAGGWPGALVAQQWLRHKSKKARFQVRFWMTVVINCIGLGFIHLVTDR